MTASRVSGFFLHCLAVSLTVCLLLNVNPTQEPVGVEVTFGPRIGSKYLLSVDRNGLSVKTAVYDPAPTYSLWHFWKWPFCRSRVQVTNSSILEASYALLRGTRTHWCDSPRWPLRCSTVQVANSSVLEVSNAQHWGTRTHWC